MDSCHRSLLALRLNALALGILHMRKILCFGEALIDLLSDNLVDQENAQESFTKFAGGAPANASVAAAKLGGNAFFCGMLGNDIFGRYLHRELQRHGVNTEYLAFTEKAKTALAFVSLDEKGERAFEFYRSPGADMMFSYADWNRDWFNEQGIFHFCSNSLTEKPIWHATMQGVSLAKERDWLISFDVNLRESLWSVDTDPRKAILPFLEHVQVLKMAREELEYLSAGSGEEAFIQHCLAHSIQLILITDGSNPLHWRSKTKQGAVNPAKIKMVDATAAGDAFVGGLLFKLSQLNQTLSAWLDKTEDLVETLSFASACGAFAASKKGAFPSLPDYQALQTFIGGANYE